MRAGGTVVLERAVWKEGECCGSKGVFVGGVEVHVGIAGGVGIGVLVEVDAIIGSQAGVFSDEVEV